jgi:hypothetical protein
VDAPLVFRKTYPFPPRQYTPSPMAIEVAPGLRAQDLFGRSPSTRFTRSTAGGITSPTASCTDTGPYSPIEPGLNPSKNLEESSGLLMPSQNWLPWVGMRFTED